MNCNTVRQFFSFNQNSAAAAAGTKTTAAWAQIWWELHSQSLSHVLPLFSTSRCNSFFSFFLHVCFFFALFPRLPSLSWPFIALLATQHFFYLLQSRDLLIINPLRQGHSDLVQHLRCYRQHHLSYKSFFFFLKEESILDDLKHTSRENKGGQLQHPFSTDFLEG